MITIIIKVIKVPDQSDHDDKNDLQSLSSGTFGLLLRLNLDESGDKRKQETAPLMSHHPSYMGQCAHRTHCALCTSYTDTYISPPFIHGTL